ncbi:MAG: hypothetical protein HFF49_05850 [Lawsonibacter sp.]|nr:hypothetical protein [Lawsonibacter sp.]
MYHKMRFRIAAALLAVCVIVAAFPGAALAVDGQTGTTRVADNVPNLDEIVANANDGDVIEIRGQCTVNDNFKGGPWVINKAVTIRGIFGPPDPADPVNGDRIYLRPSGIILAADVTFENLEFSFANRERNAIMANGHTLTLKNVTRSKSVNNDVHLFCGGATVAGANIGAQSGSHGNIIIENCPEMGNGNIYAGSISTEEKPNVSSIPATVTTIGTSKMGEFYACGASQAHVDDGQMMNPDYKVDPPAPDPGNYRVTGDVTFNLYYTSTTMVDGATGSSKNAAVAYTGKGNLNDGLTLKNLSSLTVGSGEELKPKAGSSLDGAELVVPASSILHLTNLPNPEFASLQGGGDLVLGQTQTLTIDGSVSGTTRIGVGSIFNGVSQQAPELGHVYVSAPQSADGDFELICPSNKPNLKLVRDNVGNWTVEDDSPGGEEKPPSKLVSFAPENVHLTSTESAVYAEDGILIPLNTAYSGEPLGLEDALRISVNGIDAQFTPDTTWSYYETADLLIYVGDTGDGDELIIYNGGNPYVDPVSDGIYQFDITVPGAYTASGTDLSASCTLTVGDNVTPPPTSISIPVAKTGLKWTGVEQTGVEAGAGYTLTGHKGTAVGGYTAVATLEPGYQWNDGSTDAKNILWSIAKADGPAAPIGLSATAPTSAGGADGKILGVTAEMEYAAQADFSDVKACTGTEIPNLSPGTYFVRLRSTQTHEAGVPASITVPDFNAPTVVSIRVNSTGHKTSYTVHTPLDVTGLTIEAAYSDQSTQTVPVTENMVSGFDSSTAGSKTLTITYEGRQTTYVVEVTTAEPPDPSHTHDWSTMWYNNSSHHWRECRAEGCPIKENSEKTAYGTHAAGSWITDQGATSSQAGSRHRECTICGYVMERETIPATGGSSSGGSSIGGSSSGNVSTSTQKNPDGSTTTTRKNQVTGAVTTTTKWPDGSQTVVETAKDGTITSTEKAKDGSTVKTVQNPDGSSKTTVNRADKVTAETTIDRRGKAVAQVKLPAQVTQEAQRGNKAILLPVTEMPVTSGGLISVTVQTSSKQPVKVELPVLQPGPGTVAVILHPGGAEEIVKTSVLTQQGVLLQVSDGAVVTVKDNSKYFSDANSHWAKDAIGFVSARELFQGQTASTFAPNDNMSRAMLMTVLARLDGADTVGGGTWYAGGMEWAMTHGISDGSNPEGIITREQLVSMLHRYAGSPAADSKALSFSDAQLVSGYARDSMCWAVENGIVSGYGNGLLAPNGSATRAEVAAVFKRYIELLNRKA